MKSYEILKNPFYVIIIFLILSSCNGTRKSTSFYSSPNNFKAKSLKATERIENFSDYTDYTVSIIDSCGLNIAPDLKTFSLFADYDGKLQNQNLSSLNFSGWNHTLNGSDVEWKNLKLSTNNYNFNFNSNANINNSCNNVATLDMVLVKKISDWNRQHANGFECNILAQNYKFGKIKNLVFDLKINSAKTNIPSLERLKSIYGSYVNDIIVDSLDDGKVNIGITIGDNTNLNGSIIIQLDQIKLSEKWVRVIIPINKLTFYQEINYKRTSKTLEDLSNLVINRILIVAETKSGSVLRSNIKEWNSNVPETFKEMDLSFKKIEFQLK